VTSPWAALDAHVRALMDRYGAPGFALALAREGRPVLARGFGYRDVESRLPATLDTVFPVASVTKSFTALAVMQLQDSGRLSVNDPVMTYLPEFRTPDADATSKITIHHFLTHTSGLPLLPSRWFAFARDAARDFDPGDLPVRLDSHPPIETPEQLMAFIASTPWTPLGPPGKFMSYSNEGYVLLGAIVGRVSGLPYDQYVRRHILDPLDLRQTGFDTEIPDRTELAVPYVAKAVGEAEIAVRAPRWWSSRVWLPSGGIWSSVGDLVRYLNAYRAGGVTEKGDRIVSQAAINEMMRPQTPVSPRSAYGYGFSIIDYDGETIVTHRGGRRGASSHVLFVPRRDISIAALANLEGAAPWSATHAALHLLLGQPADWQPTPYPPHRLSGRSLRTYVGEYGGSGDRRISVVVRRRGLVLEIDGRAYPARPVGEAAFAICESETEEYVRFYADGQSQPWGLRLGLAIFRRANRPVRRKRRTLRSVLSGIGRRLRRYRFG
jgi:CubicO group peptidase (beta-lactamase class C family)